MKNRDEGGVEKDEITIGALPSIWGGEGGKAGGQSIFSFRDWEQGPALLIKGCLSIVLRAFPLHFFFLSFFLLTQQVVWFASRNHGASVRMGRGRMGWRVRRRRWRRGRKGEGGGRNEAEGETWRQREWMEEDEVEEQGGEEGGTEDGCEGKAAGCG